MTLNRSRSRISISLVLTRDEGHEKQPGDKQRAHNLERRPKHVEKDGERKEKQRGQGFEQAPPGT
jgi:hypothetical protein